MRRITMFALGAALAAHGAQASTFDLEFDVPPGLTPFQLEVVDAGEAFWESLVTGYQGGAMLGPLEVELFGQPDAENFAVGGPTETVEAAGFVLPTEGFVRFDPAGLQVLEEQDLLFTTFLHEVAHVMGFGTLWQENGVYEPGSGRYTGSAGLGVYRNEFDPGARFVPVQRGFGDGVDEAHWAEDWAGGINEVMTPFGDPPEYLSETTLATFRDVGYTTVPLLVPVPVPASGWLALGALGLMGAAGRRARV